MTVDVTRLGSGFWIGGDGREGQRVFEACLRLGMTPLQALCCAQTATRPHNWQPARKIAKSAHASRSTYQRAMLTAQALGVLRITRGGKGKLPPGAREAVSWRWVDRETIGRGLDPLERAPVCARVRLSWIARQSRREQKPIEVVALMAHKPTPRQPPPGVNRVAWLNAQLAAIPMKPRDGPEN